MKKQVQENFQERATQGRESSFKGSASGESVSEESASGESVSKGESLRGASSKEEITRILAASLRPPFSGFSSDLGRLEEIRLRVHQPLAVTWASEGRFLSDEGRFCKAEEAHVVTVAELRETMSYLSSYSRYAFEDKIRQGFLTIQGGHRVGLCGRVILEAGTTVANGMISTGMAQAAGTIKTISPITFMNIRIARQLPGCGREVLPWLWEDGMLQDTLVVSSPGVGKTTLLRDLIRLLSEGQASGGGPGRALIRQTALPRSGCTVGVVDERSELAACYQGIPQNDLGPRTDVLDGCPKAEGLMMLVRTMAPQVIAVDEVGGREDCQAVEYAMNCGCRILATAHGSDWEELKHRPVFGRWMEEGRFGRYVFIEREAGSCAIKALADQGTAPRKTESQANAEKVYYRVCDRQGETLWRGLRGGGDG